MSPKKLGKLTYRTLAPNSPVSGQDALDVVRSLADDLHKLEGINPEVAAAFKLSVERAEAKARKSTRPADDETTPSS